MFVRVSVLAALITGGLLSLVGPSPLPAGAVPGDAPAADLAVTGRGYLVLDEAGGVFTFGPGAAFHGSIPGLRAAGRAIPPVRAQALAPTPGGGYLVLDEAGGVFTFGPGAAFHGSIPGLRAGGQNIPNVPAADLEPGVAGGYYVLDRAGGVFTFGGVPYHGSIPELRRSFSIPQLDVTTVVGGLTVPWDLDFAPDGTLVFTERPGRLSALVGGQRRVLAAPADVFASGESGMMGLAIDPGFVTNRTVHVCQAYQSGGTRDVRVYRWQISADWTSASRLGGPTVSGIPITSGRHGGCRPRFGPDGHLWIGTGDAATSSNPQDRSSLGGKVLRVIPSTGAPAPGNPFANEVYTYGHRNVQGLALQSGTGRMFSAEHGPARDDEVNLLATGANYGWDPGPGYDESVPMTDTAKFPSARRAVWSSGFPTIALSGIDFVRGGRWGAWDGALVGAALKGSQLRFFTLASDGGSVTAQDVAVTSFGRLRTPRLGPDGNLYVTTSNGGGADRILRVSPR